MVEFLVTVLVIINILVFFYFLFVNGSYITLIIMAYFQTKRSRQKEDLFELSGLFGTSLYRSISILAPAFNEEKSIIESTRALLNLQFSDYEVIIINDGSTDKTLEKLVENFELKEIDRHIPDLLKSKPIKKVYGSRKHPNLIVVDKENGRKADALNAGVNVSRKDLICAVDSDSLLESDVLRRMIMAFTEDQEIVAVGGVVRVANGCKFRHGVVESIRTPESYFGRVQAVEYLRAFLFGRVGWDYLNSLLIISGAFGVFDRKAVIRAGGYMHDTVGEDMELVVRLHRYYKEKNIPYRVRFLPEPVCWTEVPEDWRTLGRQRDRWHRGLADTLSRHRKMLFNPKYGRLGMIAMPFFLFVELLSPVVEMFGYLVFILSFILGVINVTFFLLFLTVAILLGVIMSVLAVLIEELTFRRYDKMKDVAILILYAFLENFGYRQLYAWWRVKGLISYMKGDLQWGEMKREGTFG
jgi:cellulose synthase/poly-beta-1,6-N-acetylglucosamine synthase-like glycosyltransferase